MVINVMQSRRRRLEVGNEARRESEARYATLINKSSDLVLVIDRDGLVSYASPSAERLLMPEGEYGQGPEGPHTGTGPGDAGLGDLFAAVDQVDRERLAMAVQSAGPDSRSIGEFRLNGITSHPTFELSIRDLTDDPSVAGIVLTAHDVTDRLALHQEMEHRALHD